MSTATFSEQETYELFTDQLMERLREKGVNTLPPCYICGHETWDVIGGTVSSIISLWGDIKPEANTMPTIPLGCGHCGFIIHFAFNAYELRD